MAPEIKTTIIAKDGQALLGKHFHTLHDKTSTTFSTTLIPVFLEYLEASQKNSEGVVIFFNGTTLMAFPVKPHHESIAIAECILFPSPILKIIGSVANQKLTLAQLEQFLFDLRDHWDGKESKELYDTVRNFSLKKITTFERKKDNAGNFHFTYSRSGEQEDVEPPEPIKFKRVPLFDLHSEGICDCTDDIQFDVVLDFVQHEDSAEVYYTLRNPFFPSTITERQKKTVEYYLKNTEIKSYWGSGKIVPMGDEWLYLDNGL